MSLHAKYNDVLKLGEELGVKDGDVQEVDGKLKIKGTAVTQHDKDQLWDKIKQVGGENAMDIEADIAVENTEYYGKYTVKSGDSLSKIAKAFYGDPMKYNAIFQANTNILKDPNIIHPGQELIIPNP